MIPVPTPEQAAALSTAERFVRLDLWEYFSNEVCPFWGIAVNTEKIHGTITIEPRPAYCDRGNFIAKANFFEFVGSQATPIPWLDSQDGWPRYYFDFWNAVMECEAWLLKRKLLP